MASLKTECRKFSPNIFNKSKCQNCFRGKDAHSSEALESNRATRKMSYCGYLFVAPDWDFSLPSNRNKRWQRRFFVLYDDGELAYSLDEHPETIPQAIIDMNHVLEVADAENVTGNPFALAVTCPEKVHFIKGTNKEESKKWFEVLSKFPENTVCGKYKRNVTFPCIKNTNVTKYDSNGISNSDMKKETIEMSNYAKHNNHVVKLNHNNIKKSGSVVFDPDDDVYPTKDTNSPINVKPHDKSFLYEDIQNIENSLANDCNYLRNGTSDNPSLKSEGVKKYLKQNGRDVRKQHSQSDISKMIPSSIDDKLNLKSEWKKVGLDLDSAEIGKSFTDSVYLLMSEVANKKVEAYDNLFGKEKTRCLRRQSSFGKKSDLQKQILSEQWNDEDFKGRTIHKSASVPNAAFLQEENKVLLNGINGRNCEDLSHHAPMKSNIGQIRGDPDGCNLDSMPSSYSAEFGDLSTECVFLKKGWLVKQDECKWNKYWFVLRNSALTYYSDPIAEDAGILDGFMDLRKVKNVSEVESSNGFTFCVLMKDFSKFYLSAVTSKIRNNWIRAIMQAGNLKPAWSEDTTKKKPDLNLSLDSQKGRSPGTGCPNSPVTNSEKYISSISKKGLEDDDQVKQNNIALPPSPPLARTAISRVKERARTRSNSRTRSSRFRSAEIQDLDHNCTVDSDDAVSDHSSSSLMNAPTTPTREKKSLKETPSKSEEKNRPERRRSFKLLNLDSLTFQDGRKKVTEVKDKLEDSSWTIWLDISKFCKEVESKLDDLEEKSPKNGPHLTTEQKKEFGNLASSLGRVEDRLQRVQNELEKAKVNLLLNGKDNELNLCVSKSIGCHSTKQEVTRLSDMPSHNALLAQQLNKVRDENRRLKSEIRVAQNSSDDFELRCASLRRTSEQTEKLHKSHMELMVARVDDLTGKLLTSEKIVRQLRQRVAKLEQRQERRRSSLKGKEVMSLSKEYEAKLTELEQKIGVVEGVLKTNEGVTSEVEKEESAKESQSLLMRLHNLDQKVKEVATNIACSSGETEVIKADIPKPKICLQVNLNESEHSHDNTEDWNSLSLSASMTDLSVTDRDVGCDNDPIAMSFGNCLESLGDKVSSLISWLKMSLQLLYAQGHMSPFETSKIDFISGEASEELSRLIRTLDHITGKMEESSSFPMNIAHTVSRLLYNVILLQEIVNIVFKVSDFEKYKATILTQHLIRVKQASLKIEQYIHQKSNPVSNSVQKTSLCNIVACLLFYQSQPKEISEVTDVQDFYEEVDRQRRKMGTVLVEFKGKFIERFCTTILELSEDSMCYKINSKKPDDTKTDLKPLGQKQFLSHISHIISQVSQSFVSHIAKSVNEVYFLCSTIQYGSKWTDYICQLLEQELSMLSAEIKNICVKHLENNFFSSSKCGVLVEYMHCSISELAQIVSIITVIDGTVILVKEALFSGSSLAKSVSVGVDKEALSTFHESLQRRALEIMTNLPAYHFPDGFFSLCNPNELNVAHRSVSSLLCFKQKWKAAVESERRDHRSELDKLASRIAELQEEQRKREEMGCKSCVELRQEVSYLQAELEESRTLARTGSLCEKCRNLRTEIQRLQDQREETLLQLKSQEALYKEQVENAIEQKEKQFKIEKDHLHHELQMTQSNLKKMEKFYDEELKKLQKVYEQKLNMKNENVREDIKLYYQEEIDQLKALCERGLTAMDVSHQKVIAELEQRHHRELEELVVDRDKALADEARATATALEAVRIAHSEELQKQVQKFKDEFVHKMNKRFETEAFKKCYESDLSNVKYEILAMTEKYSVKCLENATLHEKLESMNQQLKTTTSQVVELLAKNQQLQARLTSVCTQKQEESLI